MERHRQGVPALRFDEVPWEWSLFGNLLREVVGILVRYQVIGADEAEGLEKVAGDPSFLREAARSLYEGRELPERGTGTAGARVSRTAIHVVFWPFLSRCSEALSPLVQQGGWLRGNCPICGGVPDLGYLEKEAGARWLLCSRCDARWLFKRLECPYCGNEEQEQLSYLASEDGLYRLYLCEACREYLKVVDLRKTESEVVLPLERLLTLDMDRQAHEAGYGPHQ